MENAIISGCAILGIAYLIGTITLAAAINNARKTEKEPQQDEKQEPAKCCDDPSYVTYTVTFDGGGKCCDMFPKTGDKFPQPKPKRKPKRKK